MGYKLAGFDVIGFNEIDAKMAHQYQINHNPKFSYVEDIRTFANRLDFPAELYELDILDGSPPCSSFSMAGNREKDWGKSKVFKEGQKKQVLDTLFFDFIDLGKKLRPKVIIAENVKGLMQGLATKYVKEILVSFENAGYTVVSKCLNASKMGVPQRRERIFFVAVRNDLVNKSLKDGMFSSIRFNPIQSAEPITFDKVMDGFGKDLTAYQRAAWDIRIKSDRNISFPHKRLGNGNTCFNIQILHSEKVAGTLTSKGFDACILFDVPKNASVTEFMKMGSWPEDYQFTTNPGYLIGMSVPPVMMAHVADEVYQSIIYPNAK